MRGDEGVVPVAPLVSWDSKVVMSFGVSSRGTAWMPSQVAEQYV